MCPDASSYVVRATDPEAWVFRGGSSLRLIAVPGAKPSRYAQDGVQLVIDGETGVLSEPGKDAMTCRNDPRRAVWEHAKLGGVDFRGVGNEPPWVLEMRERSRFVLITGYGANRIERQLPPPINDNARKTTRWDAGDLQIEITAEVCHDTMSGEEFSSRVVVAWQGKVFKGCGRPLH
jgi:putative lipoprotein